MKRVLITGALSPIGRALVKSLTRSGGYEIIPCLRGVTQKVLNSQVASADYIVHLDTAYKPEDGDMFSINVGFTKDLLEAVEVSGLAPSIFFLSTNRVGDSTPYGDSKEKAEILLTDYSTRSFSPTFILRLGHEFGRGFSPYTNSVVATFCHRLTHGQEVEMLSDPETPLHLMYIDDIVDTILEKMSSGFDVFSSGPMYLKVPYSDWCLGALRATLRNFQECRESGKIPGDMHTKIVRSLYATYLSHLDSTDFGVNLPIKSDPRGALAEILKGPEVGQFFVSTLNPGMVRGNHYHDTKVERFLVLHGDAKIYLEHVYTGETIAYSVSGKDFTPVDIPPWYAHAIKNVGDSPLVTLFWASEMFDPDRPDTYPKEVTCD